MRNRNVPIVLASILVMGQPVVVAQMGNGTYTLTQDLFSSAGGAVGGGNPMRAQTTLGLPASGMMSNASCTLHAGIDMGLSPPPKPISAMISISGAIDDSSATVSVDGKPATVSGSTFTIQDIPLRLGPNALTAVASDGVGNTTTRTLTVYLDVPASQKTSRFPVQVQGTVTDPASAVSVNDVPASVSSGQFSAPVPLLTGLNTLTATATDTAGNSSSASIRVFVPPPTRPPAKPTVGTTGDPLPQVTAANSVTIGGTKTAGTSIWINGRQVVARDDATTWSAAISLSEGDNTFSIVAKDLTGAASSITSATIIKDALAPVILFEPPQKTNFNPLVLRGSVDDSQTIVMINGAAASRTARDFTLSLPLALGANTVQVDAISPNHFRSSTTVTILLGTVPAIQAFDPINGTKVYATQPRTLTIAAADRESDPIDYQLLLDGSPMAPWSPNATLPWTPTLAHLGIHRLTAVVRDAYGGSHRQDVDVWVVRVPVQAP